MIKHRFIEYLRELVLSFYKNLLDQIQRPDNLQSVLLVFAAFVSGLVAVAYAKLFKFSEVVLMNLISDKDGEFGSIES